MRKILALFLVTVLCGLFPGRLAAQTISTDTTSVTAAIASAKALYYQKIDARTTALSGPEYPIYKDEVEHPFFKTLAVQTGTITYDGLQIDSVQMQYDVHNDQVVVKYPYSPLRFVVDNRRVSGFGFDGHTFRHFAAQEGLNAGFYDVLLKGTPMQLLAKRKKNSGWKAVNSTAVETYEEKDSFFVLTENNVHLINNKKDILLLKPAEKRRLLSYMKSKKLKFRRDKEAYLLSAVQYLNSIR